MREFLSYLPEGELREDFQNAAENNDATAIEHLLAAYQPFRQSTEKFLSSMDPEAYESFIDAINNAGNDPEAQERAYRIMENFLAMMHEETEEVA